MKVYQNGRKPWPRITIFDPQKAPKISFDPKKWALKVIVDNYLALQPREIIVLNIVNIIYGFMSSKLRYLFQLVIKLPLFQLLLVFRL